MGIDVAGGDGGISACLEDLAAFSQVLLATAETVIHAGHQAAFARLEIGGCGGLDLGGANGLLDDILAQLTDSTSQAQRATDGLQAMARFVQFAATAYGHTDDSLGHLFGSALSALPGAFVKGELRFLATGNPLSGAQQLLTGDPALVDLVARVSGGWATAAVGSTFLDDGHPVVTDRMPDVSAVAVTPPRGVADLINELAERNGGEAGEVSVSFVFGGGSGSGGGAGRYAIVDIPGTKSWSPGHTSDITSLETNLQAIDGVQTSYETGVLEAMRAAGMTGDDQVMLVGHSEGGMVAVTTARDATASGEFHISHVLTAGSPIGRYVGSLPRGVQVLALEDRGDLVPRLDGKSNPDLPNVTTVSGGPDHGSIGKNHSLDDSYLPLAESVDDSSDVSIRSFTSSASGFLDKHLMTTERYLITREY